MGNKKEEINKNEMRINDTLVEEIKAEELGKGGLLYKGKISRKEEKIYVGNSGIVSTDNPLVGNPGYANREDNRKNSSH